MNSPDDAAAQPRAGHDDAHPAPPVRRTANAFGSPGADATVRRLDLNDAFIRHPDATFLMRAAGAEMRDAGIDDGDILLVDRSLAAQHGNVIIAVVDGELRCRRLVNPPGRRGPSGAAQLVAADPAVPPILITDDAPLELWGVVTTVIKSLL